MSPTVFRYKNFRFFFFSREEIRKHIHIQSTNGECKFWLEPEITLAHNQYLTDSQLNEIKFLIKEKYNDIINAWNKHFAS